MKVTPKSLIVDLLVTVREGSMPVRSLVAAAELFGIPENGLRVALARLTAAGQIERDERGQYRFGARAAAVRAQVDSWRTLERRTVAWDGTWVGVLNATAAGASTRTQQRQSTRALLFLGMRQLGRGLSIRPNNLRGGVEQVRARLLALGVPEAALVFSLSNLDDEAEKRARALWDVEALETEYRRSIQELVRSEARLPRLPVREAMVESFLLGGRVIRKLVLDPLLPEAIAPTATRQELGETMRRYDRIGRACWAGFSRQFGVPHRQTPLDTRLTGSEIFAAVDGGTA